MIGRFFRWVGYWLLAPARVVKAVIDMNGRQTRNFVLCMLMLGIMFSDLRQLAMLPFALSAAAKGLPTTFYEQQYYYLYAASGFSIFICGMIVWNVQRFTAKHGDTEFTAETENSND